ncbi:MAG: hypothetical protein R6U96_06430 [Promethearchaeia archaeon]
MNCKKLKQIVTVSLLIFIFFTPLAYGVCDQEGSKVYEEKMVCEEEDTFTDEQWQWYEAIVKIGMEFNVTLAYEGDLDLDMRLYWKRHNFDDFRGFDLTHCSLKSDEYDYADHSQIRTENTTEIGEREHLYFDNPTYTDTEDQKAYILVYVHSGEGKSEYTLKSNHEINELANDEVYECIPVILILIAYIIGAILIFGFSVYFIRRKKKKLIALEKKKQQKEKDQEEKKKKLKSVDLDSEI